MDLTKQYEQPDELVPDPTVCREFGITSMTLWRWDLDPKLEFPPAVKIRNRKFRHRSLLEKFKQRMLRDAIEQRDVRRRQRETAAA